MKYNETDAKGKIRLESPPWPLLGGELYLQVTSARESVNIQETRQR